MTKKVAFVFICGLVGVFGLSLSKTEVNSDIYEVREDEDTHSLIITYPKSEMPTLREITYYHIVEKPYASENLQITNVHEKVISELDHVAKESELITTEAEVEKELDEATNERMGNKNELVAIDNENEEVTYITEQTTEGNERKMNKTEVIEEGRDSELVTNEPEEATNEPEEVTQEPEEVTNEPKELTKESEELTKESEEVTKEPEYELVIEPEQSSNEPEQITIEHEKVKNDNEYASDNDEIEELNFYSHRHFTNSHGPYQFAIHEYQEDIMNTVYDDDSKVIDDDSNQKTIIVNDDKTEGYSEKVIEEHKRSKRDIDYTKLQEPPTIKQNLDILPDFLKWLLENGNPMNLNEEEAAAREQRSVNGGRGYGMTLTGDNGVVWNSFNGKKFSHPVGENSEMEFLQNIGENRQSRRTRNNINKDEIQNELEGTVSEDEPTTKNWSREALLIEKPETVEEIISNKELETKIVSEETVTKEEPETKDASMEAAVIEEPDTVEKAVTNEDLVIQSDSVEGVSKEEPSKDDNKVSKKTFGMSLTGNSGVVWNDLNDPRHFYNVGEHTNKTEIHYTAANDTETIPLIDINEMLNSIFGPESFKEEDDQKPELSNYIDDLFQEIDRIFQYPSENNDDKKNDNPKETGDKMKEDKEEISKNNGIFDKTGDQINKADVDQGKNDPKFNEIVDIVKEVLKNETAKLDDARICNKTDENDKKHIDKTSEIPESLQELIKNEPFWKWLESWSSTYLELLMTRIDEHIKEEVAKQIKNIELVQNHNRTKEEETHEDNNEITIDIRTTADLNDEELSTKKRKDKDNDHKKEIKEAPTNIKAKNMYGNSVGSGAVTNIFIYNINKASELENVKPVNNGTNGIYVFGNESSNIDGEEDNDKDESLEVSNESNEEEETYLTPTLDVDDDLSPKPTVEDRIQSDSGEKTKEPDTDGEITEADSTTSEETAKDSADKITEPVVEDITDSDSVATADKEQSAENETKPDVAEEISESDSESTEEKDLERSAEQTKEPEAAKEITESDSVTTVDKEQSVENETEPDVAEEITESDSEGTEEKVQSAEQTKEPEAAEKITESDSAIEEIAQSAEQINKPEESEKLTEPSSDEETKKPDVAEEITESDADTEAPASDE